MADSEYTQLLKTQASGGLNPVQQTRFNELSKLQGSSGGGGSDYASIAREQLKLMQEANAPAVASLEASIPEIGTRFSQQSAQLRAQQAPLEQRYQNLLNQITANQQKEEKRTGIAGARELGRRGISSESGFYDEFQNERLSPVTQFYTGQYAQTGQGREDAIRQLMDQINNVPLQQTEQERAVRNAIAQLQAGGSSQAIQNSLGIFQGQQQQAMQQAQLAFQREQAEREGAIQSAQLAFQQARNPLELQLLQSQIANANRTSGGGGGSSLPSLESIFGGGASAPKPAYDPFTFINQIKRSVV